MTADPSVDVPLADAEAGCNVTFRPAGEGWSFGRLVAPYAGSVCGAVSGDAGIIRWQDGIENDRGKQIVLIFEGLHTSGAMRRAVATVTMAQ